jgi:hypothetical protein
VGPATRRPLDHPGDHRDDPTGPVRTQRHRRPIHLSRQIGLEPTRSTLPVYGSSDRVPRWVRPSGLRWAVQVLGRRPGPTWPWVRWWTVRLPTVQRGRCRSVRMTPAAVAGCPHHRTVRTIGVDKAAPPVRLSGRSVSAGLSWLISSEQARSAAAAHRAGTATAGRPRCFCGGRLCPPRDPVARANVRVAGEPDTAAASAVRCRFRNRGRVSGRCCSPRTLRPELPEVVVRSVSAGWALPRPVSLAELRGEPVPEPCPRQGHGRSLQCSGLLGGQPAEL